MSAFLIATLVLSAVLLAVALVLALRSYEQAVDRVTEGTRQRLVIASPYGTHGSGRVRDERRIR